MLFLWQIVPLSKNIHKQSIKRKQYSDFSINKTNMQNSSFFDQQMVLILRERIYLMVGIWKTSDAILCGRKMLEKWSFNLILVHVKSTEKIFSYFNKKRLPSVRYSLWPLDGSTGKTNMYNSARSVSSPRTFLFRSNQDIFDVKS